MGWALAGFVVLCVFVALEYRDLVRAYREYDRRFDESIRKSLGKFG